MLKSQIVKSYLDEKARPDLAALYSLEMECQVNVARDNGEPISGEYKGKKWKAWTDGIEEWKSFRIPFNAATKPTYEDGTIKWNFDKHVEAIGMTGWNWTKLCSQWVAYDFDAIVGHSDIHSKKLTDEELAKIVELLTAIPWVQIRRSASGKGLHVYVYLMPYIKTDNHHEHAALARAILSQLGAACCFDFKSKVDICGGNMWVWHRKSVGNNGFEIIKDKTVCLEDVPLNWRDHIQVVKGIKKRITPDFVVKNQEDTFEQLCGQNLKIELDEDHKKLLDYLRSKDNGVSWWDTDRHMLVTHTIFLKDAHNDLMMRGVFDTLSKGSERGADHNCYAFPMRKGAWSIRRFSQGCSEHPSWKQDKAGWTTCFLNKEPDLATAARAMGGVDLGDGKGYQFREFEVAVKAVEALGVKMDIPPAISMRETVLKETKDGKLILEVAHGKEDNPQAMTGWANVKTKWRKVIETNATDTHEVETPICDDIVRHVVTEIERASCGWYVNSEGYWIKGSLELVRPFLKSYGHNPGLIEPIIGLSIQRSWREVNRPFENEYVGNRDWNKKGAKLRYIPNPDRENLKYPHWMKILNHVGAGLNEALKNNKWAQENGIITGADYLKCWIASLFQKPYEPLPYLFLFGPQDCGKSILYESLRLLFDRGHVEANTALLSRGDFNGELANAVLCFVEEVDLSKAKFAYNRIKNWVTSKVITIHEKNKTPYQLPNSTHWIQVANNHTFCPVFTGDTRITMISVEALSKLEVVPKHKMLVMLEKEAPDFLASVLSLEIPDSESRLSIPIITTAEKINLENINQPVVDKFVQEMCFEVPGVLTLYGELYEKFNAWLPPEMRTEYTKTRFGKEFPSKYPRGYYTANKTYVGNIAFAADTKPTNPTPWSLDEAGKLTQNLVGAPNV